MSGLQSWMLGSLGGRVALTGRVGEYPRGRTGVLVSLQSGHEPGADGPYATVAFDVMDWSDEENVPLYLLRPLTR
jgi:hypothetical protein